MTTPYFSIIMPVYNAEQSLPATIEAVLAQSDSDFEFIVIDDGSSDNSLALLLELSARDERVRLVSQTNKGVSATRNLGMGLARGEYIAFLDSDDHWHSDKLAMHRRVHAAQPLADASFAKVVFVESGHNPDWNHGRQSGATNQTYSTTDFLAENPSCTMSNIVVRRQAALAVGSFMHGMSFAEDQEWLLRLMDSGFHLIGIDKALVGYMVSENGLSANFDAMHSGWRELFDRYGPVKDRSAAEALYFRYLARRALRMGSSAGIAAYYARKGLRINARSFFADGKRGWATLCGCFAAYLLPRPIRTQIFA